MNEQDIANQEQQLSSFPKPVVSDADSSKLITPTAQAFDIGFGTTNGETNYHPEDIPEEAKAGVKKAGQALHLASLTSNVNPTNASTATPEQKLGFVDTFKNILKESAQDPISTQANKAYFGALMTGSGVQGAAKAYTDVFQEMSKLQATGKNQIELAKVQDTLKNGALNAQSQQIGINTIKALATAGLEPQQAQQVGQSVQQIVRMAHEKPEAAATASSSLLKDLRDANIPESTLMKVADSLPHAKTEQSLKYEQSLASADVSDRIIKKIRYGIATDKEIQAANAKVQEKQLELKRLEEIQKAEVTNAQRLAALPIHNAEAAGTASAQLAKEKAAVLGGGVGGGGGRLQSVGALLGQPSVTGATQSVPPAPSLGSTSRPAAGPAPVVQSTTPAPQAPGKASSFEASQPEPTIKAAESNIKAHEDYAKEIRQLQPAMGKQEQLVKSLLQDVEQYPDLFGRVGKSSAKQAWVNWAKNPEDSAMKQKLVQELGLNAEQRTQFDRISGNLASLVLTAKQGVTARLADSNSDAKAITDTVANIANQPGAVKAQLQQLATDIKYSRDKFAMYGKEVKNAGRSSPSQFEAWYDENRGNKIREEGYSGARSEATGNKQSGAIKEGTTSTSKSGKPIIYRNGQWEYQ